MILWIVGAALGALFLFGKPAGPKVGTEIKLRDSTDKSVRLRFQQAGAGFGFVPIDKANFARGSQITLFSRKWNWFEGLNAFVAEAG